MMRYDHNNFNPIRFLRNNINFRKVTVALAGIVVFVTTYALILPAIALEERNATQESGIYLEMETEEEAGTEWETIPSEDTGEEERYSESTAENTAEAAVETADTAAEPELPEETAAPEEVTAEPEEEATPAFVPAAGKATAKENNYDISVTFDDKAGLPADTKLSVLNGAKKLLSKGLNSAADFVTGNTGSVETAEFETDAFSVYGVVYTVDAKHRKGLPKQGPGSALYIAQLYKG